MNITLGRFLCILAMMITLVSCASSDDSDKDKNKDTAKSVKENPKPIAENVLPICPQVAIVRELQNIHDYGQEKPEAGQLVAAAEMKSVNGTCEYKKDGIDVVFDLTMTAARGPKLGGLHTGFPFFVAVVDPNETVLSKERLTAEFGFSSDSRSADYAESLHVFIPLTKPQQSKGPDYQVLMGFQLTKDQLDEAEKQP